MLKNIKKILLTVFVIGIFVNVTCFAAESRTEQDYKDSKFPYSDVAEGIDKNGADTELQNMVNTETVDYESTYTKKGFFQYLLSVFGVGEFVDGATASGNNYIIRVMNYGLGLMALIALVFIIYGFGKMFFSEDENSYESAKKIIINSAIAIFVIGFSRFVVSFLFYIYSITNDNLDVNTNTQGQNQNL